jgi:hypothetical protein
LSNQQQQDQQNKTTTADILMMYLTRLVEDLIIPVPVLSSAENENKTPSQPTKSGLGRLGKRLIHPFFGLSAFL